jgi:Na+-transporting methylmalonyl-CoA/oxaloacetate decarboxylase gamma subunit
MSSVEQGIEIMVAGLSITFAALAIFIGIILLLQRLFPSEHGVEEERRKAADQQDKNLSTRDTSEEEIAVAITVALAQLYSYELCRSDLGVSLEQSRSPWWTVGRLEQTPLDIVPGQGRK